MIKKLDKLILKSFIGPFIATFFIAFFVIMMQTLWKYIDDLVGKDLDMLTIGKFIWYASASLITLAMPIAILISSIMTFGNLGETYELVAIKSAGISLIRFMRPLVWVALLLCGITFLFANYIIPYANLKFKALYLDIAYKKPALDLKPGTFYTQIPGFVIKVDKKDKDGKTIHNILIYEQQNQLQDNSIIAEKGTMQSSPDKKFLEFTLQNGYRYQERGNAVDTNTEFIRMGFKEYKKLFDLSALQMTKTSDTVFKNDLKMLSVRQLGKALDSIGKLNDSLTGEINKLFISQIPGFIIPDSIWKKAAVPLKKIKKFDELVPADAKRTVYENALNVASNFNYSMQTLGMEISPHKVDSLLGEIEWHRKFSLSLSCLILFFIGAPLGSIIRKGGLGMPLVVAIVFFLIFHLLNMFGEKFAKESFVSPFTGMWLAILALTPLCVFLTYKAMHDSQLFNKEFYHRFFKYLKNLLNKKTPQEKTD